MFDIGPEGFKMSELGKMVSTPAPEVNGDCPTINTSRSPPGGFVATGEVKLLWPMEMARGVR
jgi:hypothetical protein